MKKAKCKLVRVCSDEVVIKRAHLREDIREARQGIKRDERALSGLGAYGPMVRRLSVLADGRVEYIADFDVERGSTLEFEMGPVSEDDKEYGFKPYHPEANLVMRHQVRGIGTIPSVIRSWADAGPQHITVQVQSQLPDGHAWAQWFLVPKGHGVEQLIDYVAERGGI